MPDELQREALTGDGGEQRAGQMFGKLEEAYGTELPPLGQRIPGQARSEGLQIRESPLLHLPDHRLLQP